MAPSDRPIRVLHVVRSLETGGLEQLVCDLVLGRGIQDTSVACLTQVGILGEGLRARGVSVAKVGMQGGAPSAMVRLAGLIRRLRPDVVHCHNMLSLLHGGLTARVCGVRRLVLTKHGNQMPMKGIGLRMSRWLLRRTHVVAVSEEIRDLVRTWFPSGVAGLHYIPNGISLDSYSNLPSRPEARRRLGWSGEEFLVGIVARLAGSKDHENLLHAFGELRRSIPRARLVVVGDGPRRAVIEESIEQLGLVGAVSLLGDRRDIPEILAALDVFALSSRTEGIPLTILEAMAARLPIVTTAVGGIPQVVRDGVNGLLVPPSTPPALAQALLRVAHNPGLADRMGEAGRRQIEERFDIRRVVSRYEAIYRPPTTAAAKYPSPCPTSLEGASDVSAPDADIPSLKRAGIGRAFSRLSNIPASSRWWFSYR